MKNILEAALMTSNGTMSVSRFVSLFEKDVEQPEKADIRAALAELQEDYQDRGIELREVASGFRFQVRSEYAEWVNRLFDEKPQRYSRALLETLAIIAYRQPITRGEIEDIRGVSISSGIIRTLQEREWIRVVGHRDVPGKPELLATTRQFLDYFNLKKLSDLPSLAEIKDFDKINPDLFEELEAGEQGKEDAGEAVEDAQGQDGPALAVIDNPELAESGPEETAQAEPVQEEPVQEASVQPDEAAEAGSESAGAADAASEDDDEDVAAGDNVVPFSG